MLFPDNYTNKGNTKGVRKEHRKKAIRKEEFKT